MNNIKKRNLIELIGCGVLIIFTLIPGMFTISTWKYNSNSTVYHGMATKKGEVMSSFFGSVFAGSALHIVLGVFTYLALIACVVLAIFQFISKDKKQNSLIIVVLSGVSFVLYFICAMCLEFVPKETASYQYSYDVYALFWIYSIMFVGFIIFAIITYTKLKNSTVVDNVINKSQVEQNNVCQSDSNINHVKKEEDALKRYKNLLDEGLITAEDYEKKKKQILGL